MKGGFKFQVQRLNHRSLAGRRIVGGRRRKAQELQVGTLSCKGKISHAMDESAMRIGGPREKGILTRH